MEGKEKKKTNSYCGRGEAALISSLKVLIGYVCEKAVRMRDALAFYERGAVLCTAPRVKPRWSARGKKAFILLCEA